MLYCICEGLAEKPVLFLAVPDEHREGAKTSPAAVQVRKIESDPGSGTEAKRKRDRGWQICTKSTARETTTKKETGRAEKTGAEAVSIRHLIQRR